MNHKLFYTLIFGSVLFLSSCAYDIVGFVYTDTQLPMGATSNDVGTKVGTSEAMSILGIYAGGDGSINTAAKDGNIKKISHVDVERFGILGLYFRQTTYVYGN